MERRTILVVDDTAAIREMIADALMGEGYPVETASNGSEALEALERIHPCLILLDLHMPVLDGWGFARALASRSLRVPIVVLTAAGNAGRYAKEVGAVGCVSKPFALLDLLDTVEGAYRAECSPA